MRLNFIYLFLLLLFPSFAYAYIDPGSGSLIIQVVIAGIVSSIFALKIFWQKIKNFFTEKFSKKIDE